jgi:ribosomal protein L24E
MSTGEPPLLAQARLTGAMAKELAAAFSDGWDRILFEASVVDRHTATRCRVERGGETVVENPPASRALADSVAELRAVMHAPGAGTWFAMTLTVTATGRAETTFSYDDEPRFSLPPGPEAYVRDLERFPRDVDKQPAWLRARIAEAALTPRQRRLADLGRALLRRAAGADVPLSVTPLPEDDAVMVAHAVRGGGRVYVAADETVLFAGSAAPPHKAIEVFRSGRRTPLEHFRPAYAPNERETPGPTTAPEPAPKPPYSVQDRLAETLATELAAAQSTDWDRIRFTVSVVDGHTRSQCFGERDGMPTAAREARTGTFAEALAALRAAMHTPGRGTWFGMTLTFTPDDLAETAFDYDDEPQFLPPLDPEAYARDLEQYPRDVDRQPAWLRERLSWAALTSRQRRLADLGRSFLQTVPMVGGSRPLFPVTVLPEEDAVVVTSAQSGERAYVAADETVRLVDTPPAAPPAPAPVYRPVPDAELSTRQRELAAHGRSLFARLAAAAGAAFDDASTAVVPLDDGSVAVARQTRGGGKMYVAADRTVYYVGSAVDFDTGLREFRAGARTAPEKFPTPPEAHSAPDLLDEAQAPALAVLLAEESGTHVLPARDGVLLQVGDMELDWTVRRSAHGFTLTHRNRGSKSTTEATHYSDLARLLVLTLSPGSHRGGRPRLTRFDVDPTIVLGGTRREPEASWQADGQDHHVQGPALYGLVLPFAKLCRGTFEEIRRSLADPAGLPLLGKRTTESLTVPLDREHLPQVARWLADVKADWYNAQSWYDVFDQPCFPGQIVALGGGAEPELALVEHDGVHAVRDRDGEIFRSADLDQAVRALALEWLATRDVRPRPPNPTSEERAALLERFAGAPLDRIERALATAEPHRA